VVPGLSVTDIILSVTLYLIMSLPTHAASYIYISGHYTACLYVFALPTRWNCRGLDESIGEGGSGGGTTRLGPVFQVAHGGIISMESMVVDPHCDLQIREIVGHEGESLSCTIPQGKASGMNNVGV